MDPFSEFLGGLDDIFIDVVERGFDLGEEFLRDDLGISNPFAPNTLPGVVDPVPAAPSAPFAPPGSIGGIPLTTLLLIGAVGLAAVVLIRR